MKTFSIPYTASPVNHSRAIVGILILLASLSAAYAQHSTFEVASIRPAPPLDPRRIASTRCTGGPGTRDPGRWICENISLPNLIRAAFDLKGFELPPLPSLDNERFTITAKIPEGATKDQFRQMQQNLLVERFGLKFHHENKEMQGYELVVARNGPKLKESGPELPKDPAADPSSAPTSLPKLTIGKDGFPTMPPERTGIIITTGRARGQWIRTTMEDFAFNLQLTGLGKPVIDGTGLKGEYDISLAWAPEQMGGFATPPGAETTLPAASEPSGGPNIFTALQEQLGLKLLAKKVTIGIFVVDHIEKAPTEN